MRTRIVSAGGLLGVVFIAGLVGGRFAVPESWREGTPVGARSDGEHGLYLPLNEPDPAVEETLSGGPLSGSLVLVGHLDGDYHALAIGGGRLFAARGTTLVAYDLGNPGAPAELGSWDGNYEIGTFAIGGSHAYVLDAMSQVNAIDVSQPGAMSLVSTTEIEMGITTDAVVVGHVLYLAEAPVQQDIPSGLRLLDVADPAEPIERSLRVLAAMEATAVEVVSGTAYVAWRASDKSGELDMFDVSDPSVPRPISGVMSAGGVVGLALSGTRAYINASRPEAGIAELSVIDLSDVSEAYAMGAYTFPDGKTALADAGFSSGYSQVPRLGRLLANGSEVLSLENHYGIGSDETEPRSRHVLRAIDVSNDSGPVSISSIELPIEYAYDMAMSGRYEYVAGGRSGLMVIEQEE